MPWSYWHTEKMNKQTIICDNVDMDQLHQQKKELVELIWKNKDSNLWGLVHLIDAIEDAHEIKNQTEKTKHE